MFFYPSRNKNHRPISFNFLLVFLFCCPIQKTYSQLLVARDTINVLQNNYCLKYPWTNGINYSMPSHIDLNNDGTKDLVFFDKANQYGTGKFRCFLKTGLPGTTSYSASPDLGYFFPLINNWAILKDYNCDGKEDIFCSTSGGIMVYKNISSASNPINFQLAKALVYSNYSPSSPSPTYYNLYASTAGLPGIADVDNDGDLDIITFTPNGYLMEYHLNMSKELYGNCDSLVYQINNSCWGNVSENSCVVSMSQTCAPVFRIKNDTTKTEQVLHAGSCLMCIDMNGDGLKDLLMGDVSCNVIQLATNTGSINFALISDTTKLFPSAIQQIKMNNFPCTYTVDADGDGKLDLIATPNAFGSENAKSVWLYKNISTTPTLSFNFVQKDFIQSDEIDVGQNSYPTLIDYNADGKKDLLIGTFGYYNAPNLIASLTLYQNIGTNSQPSFSLITRDYASLSTYSINNIMPAIGDVDGDGDIDIVIGNSYGVLAWLKNTAGAGNPCNFSQYIPNAFSFTTQAASASPQLFDVNKDGKLDLLIGMKNGKIAYYQNTGIVGTPTFSLITNTFGNINVQGSIYQYGIDGYAVPFAYNDGLNTNILVGSVSGAIFQYQFPSVFSPTVTFTQLNSTVNGLFEGGQSTVWYEDINNDAKPDLFMGNASGGLSFFSSKSPNIGLNENMFSETANNIVLFPNPASENIFIKINRADVFMLSVYIYNSNGELVLSKKTTNIANGFFVSELSKGLYFAKINYETFNGNFFTNKKFIKE
ncbi:MAG: T9SS type A sorting domain-containing protein [Bacteroidetes bacterium]|nr:T9SS type A sorting domain-containing protein [Bacteroidota bacterium]